MFEGFGIAYASAVLAYEIEWHREECFRKYLASLPEHMRPTAIKQHEEAREKERLERTADRRHQELCDAIRSTRARGFGIFW